MTDKIEEATRKQVAKILPVLMTKAIKNYQDLMNMNPENAQSKKYKDHQDACRSAAIHLESLIKLGQTTGVPAAPPGGGEEELLQILNAAAAEKQTADEKILEGDLDDDEVV